jgi:hypothetical protein
MDKKNDSDTTREIETASIEKELGRKEVNIDTNCLPAILQNHSVDGLAALEKTLVRKIDFRSLPVLIILFLLNILDRNAIANARLSTLEADLKMSDVQYQTAVMVLWGKRIFNRVDWNILLTGPSWIY